MGQPSSSTPLPRRDFVKLTLAFLGSVMGAVIALPGIGYMISPAVRTSIKEDWIPLGPLESYLVGIPTRFKFTRATVNGWEKTINSYGVYVSRKDESHVKVFSDICTHLGCRVTWHPDIQEYVSPCHDGHFDIDGYVTIGPPPHPLDHFETRIEDGILFIHLVS